MMWLPTFDLNSLTPWLAAASAFAVTLLTAPIVRGFALRIGCIDKPTGDRWGRRVVARLGGVAIFLGVLASAAAWLIHDRMVAGLLAGCAMVFLLGVVDDLRRLRPYTKLLWQIAVGCFMVAWGIRIEMIAWPWLSVPLSVFWFVLMMNAFNLLDNMDGLAAGIGAIASAVCAVHAALSGEAATAAMAAIITGACLGFLRFNFPPAKMYMGDAGSHLLGLSLAAVALLGTWRRSTQLIGIIMVPVLVLAVPIFDTCFVTVQRLMHRQHPFQGGKDHVSHRLAILGLSSRQTVLALYGVSAALGGIGVWSAWLTPWGAAVTWLLTLTGILLLGAYLGKVKVYQLNRLPAGAPEGTAPTTMIKTMLLHKRRLVEVAVDVCLISTAYVGAHMLRFEGAISPDIQQRIWQSLPLILVIKLACFAGCGLYRGVWRYLSLSDILTVFKAVTAGSVLSTLAVLYLWRFHGYSRAVFLIDWMGLFLAVGGSRVMERLLNEWIGSVSEKPGASTLIIGAGDTGARVLRVLKLEGKPVLGFLDDDRGKFGERIQGCRVLGTRARLAELLAEHDVRQVLVAVSDPPGELLRHVQACCEPKGVTWKIVTAGVADAL